MAMLAFKAAYRAAGFEPIDAELPDYLPLVLDFAALHPRGEKLLRSHRADLELLLRALRDAQSPYADVIEAVCAQLPALRRLARCWCERVLGVRPARRRGRPGAVRAAGVPGNGRPR